MLRHKPKRILVPDSGSVASEEALRIACDVAKRYHAQLTVVYVIEVKRALPITAPMEPEASHGEEILARAERVAEEASTEVETDLIQAREVGPAIVEEILERQADLVIMGVEHKRRLGEFNLGRTAPYVLRHAPCAVWLYSEPPPKESR
jgi:nucleotide-binding universal stress UspA family protein